METPEQPHSRPSSFKRSFDDLDTAEGSDSRLGIALLVAGEDSARNDRNKRARSQSSSPSRSTTNDPHISRETFTPVQNTSTSSTSTATRSSSPIEDSHAGPSRGHLATRRDGPDISIEDAMMPIESSAVPQDELPPHPLYTQPTSYSALSGPSTRASASAPGDVTSPHALVDIYSVVDEAEFLDPEPSMFTSLEVTPPVPTRHIASSSGSVANENNNEDRFRMSIERFHTFDGHISILRNSTSAREETSSSRAPNMDQDHPNMNREIPTHLDPDEEMWLEAPPPALFRANPSPPPSANDASRATAASENLSYSEHLSRVLDERRRSEEVLRGRDQSARRPPQWTVPSPATRYTQSSSTYQPSSEAGLARHMENMRRDFLAARAQEALRLRGRDIQEAPRNSSPAERRVESGWATVYAAHSNQGIRRREHNDHRESWAPAAWPPAYLHPPSNTSHAGASASASLSNQSGPTATSTASRSRRATSEVDETEAAWLFNELEDRYQAATDDPLSSAPSRYQNPSSLRRGFPYNSRPTGEYTSHTSGVSHTPSSAATPSRDSPIPTGVRQRIPRISLLDESFDDEPQEVWSRRRPRARPPYIPDGHHDTFPPPPERLRTQRPFYFGDRLDDSLSEGETREQPTPTNLPRNARDTSYTLGAEEDLDDARVFPQVRPWADRIFPGGHVARLATPSDQTEIPRMFEVPESQRRMIRDPTSRDDDSMNWHQMYLRPSPSPEAAPSRQTLQDRARQLLARRRNAQVVPVDWNNGSPIYDHSPALRHSEAHTNHDSRAGQTSPPARAFPEISAEEEEVEALLSANRRDRARRNLPISHTHTDRPRYPGSRTSHGLPPIHRLVREVVVDDGDNYVNARNSSFPPRERNVVPVDGDHGSVSPYSIASADEYTVGDPSTLSRSDSARNGSNSTTPPSALYYPNTRLQDLTSSIEDEVSRAGVRLRRRPVGPGSSTTAGSEPDTTLRTGGLDLEHYHEGPFRASLARSERLRRERESEQQFASRNSEASREPLYAQPSSSTATSAAADAPWAMHTPSSRAGPATRDLRPADATLDRRADALRAEFHEERLTRLRNLRNHARPDTREDQRELHETVIRHSRAPAARLAGADNASIPDPLLSLLPDAGANATRQQQLIDNFHARRAASTRQGVRSGWGDIDETSDQVPWRPRRLARHVPPGSASNTDDWSLSRSTNQAQTPGQRRGRFLNAWRRSDSASFRMRAFGDFVRDEDFDTSYEGLLHLTSMIGEARPRGTPRSVIDGLPSGIYSDWTTPGSEQRCPICLDDYEQSDPVMKLPVCSHWFHKGCLEQWLGTASTCPVCRGRVDPNAGPSINTARSTRASRLRRPASPYDPAAAFAGGPLPGPSNSERRDREEGEDDDQAYFMRSLRMFGRRGRDV